MGVLGALFLLYKTFDISNWQTWFWIGWIIIYSLFIYCLIDVDRWNKLENILGPLIEDLDLSTAITFPIIGIIYSIYLLAINDTSNHPVGILIGMSLFLIFDFILIKDGIMTFNFVDWIKEKRAKKKKEK